MVNEGSNEIAEMLKNAIREEAVRDCECQMQNGVLYNKWLVVSEMLGAGHYAAVSYGYLAELAVDQKCPKAFEVSVEEEVKRKLRQDGLNHCVGVLEQRPMPLPAWWCVHKEKPEGAGMRFHGQHAFAQGL
jgi:hypothetical protein